MRNLTIYLTVFLTLLLTNVFSQETFEDRAKTIATKIESITKEEKAALKTEVEEINSQLEKGSLTKEQADEKKKAVADVRAKAIEFRVTQAQNELIDLVQQKVDGKIKEQDSTRRYTFTFPKKKYKDNNQGEKRTTSQLVIAFGLNNLVSGKKISNSDYKYLGSHFYEWGLSYNTRIMKNNNLLHAKYGLSLMYNNLRPTDNRYFAENGKQTNLVTSATNLEDSRFRNINLVVPIHLEFDFSKKEIKNDKVIFNSHESFRFGIGGFAGVNIKTKQVLDYEINNNDVKTRTKGNYNVNDFVYGASVYIGYDEMSLYAKYDLSPLFKNNVVDQNNVSLGVRFDFN